MSEKSIAEYQDASLRVACRQNRRMTDATTFAKCDTCGHVIRAHGYWSLDSSVWLHLHGSGEGHRVSYYEEYFVK